LKEILLSTINLFLLLLTQIKFLILIVDFLLTWLKSSDMLGRCGGGSGGSTTYYFIRNIKTYVSIYTISMAIYVRGTYRQTQLFYWLIIGRFTTTCFGPIPGPSSGCITT